MVVKVRDEYITFFSAVDPNRVFELTLLMSLTTKRCDKVAFCGEYANAVVHVVTYIHFVSNYGDINGELKLSRITAKTSKLT